MTQKTSGVTHPYHIVEPSPWPIVGSISAFVLALGAIMYMQEQGSWLFFGGIGLLLYTCWGWWRDVVKESKTDHTIQVRHGLKYGMALFILSEVFFFVAFFWAYFNASIFPTEATGGVWPPKGIETLDPFGLPYLNTLILLLSGTTITWAHFDLLENKQQEFLKKLGYTVILGVVFLFVQAYEYGHAAFAFDEGIYPSTFYMATGFHGAHVLIGTIFLAVCWFRGRESHFTADDHFGFEAAAWYWHFVDVVWLFLFVSIYWWGSA
ncbi:MAG: cytochrome c oxidase subunit 3 [Alphaproteobacteria bacterium]